MSRFVKEMCCESSLVWVPSSLGSFWLAEVVSKQTNSESVELCDIFFSQDESRKSVELQIWRRFICSCKCVANVPKNLRRKAGEMGELIHGGWKVGMWERNWEKYS